MARRQPPKTTKQPRANTERTHTCNTIHIVFILGRDLHERLLRVDVLRREVKAGPSGSRYDDEEAYCVQHEYGVPQGQRGACEAEKGSTSARERSGWEDCRGAEQESRHEGEDAQVDNGIGVRGICLVDGGTGQHESVEGESDMKRVDSNVQLVVLSD